MAVLFSQVIVLSDNGSKESFLCSGIPKREEDFENWIKYQNFVKDNPNTETVEVNVKSFVYGDGDITDANEYEVAYFTKRGEDFLERSTVKPYGESKFIILTDDGGRKEMVSDVGKEVLRDIGLLVEYIIRKSKGYDDMADDCIKDKIIRDMAEMTSRMKNEIRLVCIDDLRILNDNHNIAVVEYVDMLDDAVKKEPYNNNEVKFKADAVISMVLDIIHQNIREDVDYKKISEGVINENVQI